MKAACFRARDDDDLCFAGCDDQIAERGAGLMPTVLIFHAVFCEIRMAAPCQLNSGLIQGGLWLFNLRQQRGDDCVVLVCLVSCDGRCQRVLKGHTLQRPDFFPVLDLDADTLEPLGIRRYQRQVCFGIVQADIKVAFVFGDSVTLPVLFAHAVEGVHDPRHAAERTGAARRVHILHVVIVLAAHEVEEIEDIFFNDGIVALDGNGDATADPYKQGSTVYASVYKHLGTASQLADTVLVANSSGKWSSGHRLRGLAYVHAQLRFDEKAYASGLPNISALIKGRKVYDPRTEETEWSENAALCILDYVTSEFGLNATLDEIDLNSFIAAANICDEEVDTIDGTESRYTCNGVVDLAAKPRDILEDMLSSCAGFLTYTGGKWRLKVGAYNAPMYTLEAQHAREAVMLKPHRSRRSLINTVRGAFISPDHQWQPTDYPEISNSAYVTQDGDEQTAATLDLPFTQSSTMAQRIALIALEQNRRQKQILFPSNLVGFQLAAGNTIAVDLPRFGLADNH